MTRIEKGSLVEVKIHRVVKNVDALADAGGEAVGGAALLLQFAGSGEDDQIASSREVDASLYGRDV